MVKRTHREQSARCKCMNGGNAHREHSKPGKTAADHGDVFRHRGGCIHSELSNTTKPVAKPRTVPRLKFM